MSDDGESGGNTNHTDDPLGVDELLAGREPPARPLSQSEQDALAEAAQQEQEFADRQARLRRRFRRFQVYAAITGGLLATLPMMSLWAWPMFLPGAVAGWLIVRLDLNFVYSAILFMAFCMPVTLLVFHPLSVFIFWIMYPPSGAFIHYWYDIERW